MKLILTDNTGQSWTTKVDLGSHRRGGNEHTAIEVYSIHLPDGAEADVAEALQDDVNTAQLFAERGTQFWDGFGEEEDRWFLWELVPTNAQDRRYFRDYEFSDEPVLHKEKPGTKIVLDDGSRAAWGKGQWRGPRGVRLGTTFDLIESGRTFTPLT